MDLLKKNQNPNWPYICNYCYRILKISDSGLRDTNVLLNFMDHQPNIDKIFTRQRPYESKYKLLINKKEKSGIKHSKHAKGSTDYFQTIDDVYKNLGDHNITKKKINFFYDYMIADIKYDKKLMSIFTE